MILRKEKKLCEFLEPILQSAFDSLGEVEIPEDEIENISLNTIATVHEPSKSFINDYHNFSTGISGIISQNQEIFNGITDFASPINAILDSSALGLLTIPESLKVSLESIETAKTSLLASDSFASLNSITENYNELFSEARSELVIGFEGLKTSSEILKYISGTENYLPKNNVEGDE